jgi:apolipoprotein N-acyltransferase
VKARLAAAGIASALLHHFALPGAGLPWLGWTALLPLLGALLFWRPDPRTAGRWLGWSYAIPFGLLTFRWMTNLSAAAGMTVPWLLWPGVFLWVLYLGLYPWLFVRLLAAARGRYGAAALLLAPPLWTALSWLRGSGVLAFSWVHLSQTQAAPGGYLAPAAWFGGLGLGFLMVLLQVGVLLAFLPRGPRRLGAITLAGTLALLALCALPGHREGEERVTVAALQGNIALEDKWEPSFRMENLRIYSEMGERAVAAGAELLIWPETAFPVSIFYDRGAEAALRRTARELGVDILTGFQGLSAAAPGGYSYRNACGLISSNGAFEGSYSKQRLLPFGERIPLVDFLAPGLDIDLGQSNFTPGPGVRIFEAASLRCAPFICYEMGFASDLRRAATDGAQLLVNISNDGWFAHPLALDLHAALSPMRAAENGVPVLRCGNNGVTEIIDARGRRQGVLPTDTREMLLGEIRPAARPSFYARHGGWSGLLLWTLYSLLVSSGLWRSSWASSAAAATGRDQRLS